MKDLATRWQEYVETATNIRRGTTAHHKLGDISRPHGDFFYVDREERDDYVGRWMTGFGFVEVRFPKRTTRTITPGEREWLAAHPVALS